MFIILLGIWVIREGGNSIRPFFGGGRLLRINDNVSTKSIVMFIILLDIWVIPADGNSIRLFFGGGKFLKTMIMFQKI